MEQNDKQPTNIGNTKWQEEQQTTEPMDFISFASWTQSTTVCQKSTSIHVTTIWHTSRHVSQNLATRQGQLQC